VEGGAAVATSLLRQGLVDRLYWFRAPIVIGGDGLPAVAGLDVETLGDACSLIAHGREQVGQDVLETFDRKV
jgi:diaminohydroxyphosphoribosylaminopyrimidine deaminase/5-amino-6-(5-phosphoribosylamino)uracil reductase